MRPDDLLRSTTPPWVLLCVLPEANAPDIAAEPVRGEVVRRIEGRRCATKAGVLSEFARALEFPPYFGENWDAFEECLTDLSWMPAPGYLIVITDAEQVLPDREEDYATLIDCLGSAGQEWAARRATPFHVVMTVSKQDESARAEWRVPRVTC